MPLTELSTHDQAAARILVVDDEESIRLLLRWELEERGWQVSCARDGREAMEVVAREPTAIVLTDIRMPGMDGLELTRKLRAVVGGPDVVLMTGHASLESAAEGLRLGAADYLLKPFGDVELVVASLDRVVERQRLLRATSALREQVHLADRLASVGLVAGGVAHEINNPACYILGNSALMREHIDGFGQLFDSLHRFAEAELPAELGERLLGLLEEHHAAASHRELRQMLIENTEGVQRITEIVRSMRNLARRDTSGGDMPVNEAVQQALTLVRGSLLPLARVEVALADLPSKARFSTDLVQVLLNLLLLASRALDTGPGPADARVLVTSASHGAHVEVSLTFRGGHLPLNIERSLGDGFVPVEDLNEDTLGLSIASSIVGAHGGRLGVRATGDGETTIQLVLPVQERLPDTGAFGRPAPVAYDEDTPVYAEDAPRPRVLVADDDALNLSVLRRLLERGHDVVTARGAPDMLQKLAGPEPFDALVVELMMSDLDPKRLGEVIERQHPELTHRILFVSSASLTARSRGFVQRFPERVLFRPLSEELLTIAIEELVNAE